MALSQNLIPVTVTPNSQISLHAEREEHLSMSHRQAPSQLLDNTTSKSLLARTRLHVLEQGGQLGKVRSLTPRAVVRSRVVVRAKQIPAFAHVVKIEITDILSTLFAVCCRLVEVDDVDARCTGPALEMGYLSL
jgi:hypothetical protein